MRFFVQNQGGDSAGAVADTVSITPAAVVDSLIEKITVLRRAMYQGMLKGHRRASLFTTPLRNAAHVLAFLNNPKSLHSRVEVIASTQEYLMEALKRGNHLLRGSDWDMAARQITQLHDEVGDLPLSLSQSTPAGSAP